MPDINKGSVSPPSGESITILGVKVPTTTQFLKQSKLRFYADNPRVYSVVRANGKVPTQDEIQQQLSELDHVRELRDDIRRNGGLLEPLIVRDGTLDVLEGNSRLAAYRQLAAKEPIKWAEVKCTVLPADVEESLIFALLGQFHIKGKKDWAPYEQAGFLYRRFKTHNVTASKLASELGLSAKKVGHLIDTYDFMVKHDEVDINKWSYYDEYLKSNKIKKARNQHPGMDDLVVESIKSGDIERAMDLRDQLPVVCASPVVLKKFAEGKITLGDAHERAVDSGADSVPYKRATAFRKWITEPEIDTILASCPGRVRDKLLYELRKIALRIAALEKKHG
ncbi:MAG: ParB-like nuclease domain-containing protein [Acidobacteria bacterium]|nr:ParB-like nuclease domain-containing protein [Acidobacteriota bacterium]